MQHAIHEHLPKLVSCGGRVWGRRVAGGRGRRVVEIGVVEGEGGGLKVGGGVGCGSVIIYWIYL